jgi:hypothetical protein
MDPDPSHPLSKSASYKARTEPTAAILVIEAQRQNRSHAAMLSHSWDTEPYNYTDFTGMVLAEGVWSS